MVIENLKESVTIDLIVRAYELIDDLIKDNPLLTDDEKKNLMQRFESELKHHVSRLNIAWVPNTLSFHPILDIDAKNRTITVDTDNPYDATNVRFELIDWGNKYFRDNLLLTINHLFERRSIDSNITTLLDYILFMSYIGAVTFNFILSFLLYDARLLQLNTIDSMAYIFLSYQVNLFWNHIVNKNSITIMHEDGYQIIPWIKPTIAVHPDLRILIRHIDINDMSSILITNEE